MRMRFLSMFFMVFLMFLRQVLFLHFWDNFRFSLELQFLLNSLIEIFGLRTLVMFSLTQLVVLVNFLHSVWVKNLSILMQ